uniref:Uncharacterized protein n=1 Tax=viral metagenome TaxID=1070528 RepID=A0A6M3KKS3_9ZZZZ
MNRYKITNKETGEIVEREAEYLGHAIEALGWPPDSCECEIIPLKKTRGRKKASEEPASVEPIDDAGEVEASEDIEAGRVESFDTAEEIVAESQEEPTIDPEQSEEGPPVSPEVAEKLRAQAQEDQDNAASHEYSKRLKKLKKEIDAIDIHALTDNASEAEKTAYENKKRIEAMALEAEVMFLRMGQLLYDAREKGEWTILHYESYREYVEDLSLPMTNSYSWATRLSSIYEYLVKNMGLDEKLLAEIGVAKLTRLLPLARSGNLTEEVLEAARILSDLDLRAELGHSVGGGGDSEQMIVCPRCGETFDAKKATRP